jgi:uncharacterized protein YeaO (DUF488 family)
LPVWYEQSLLAFPCCFVHRGAQLPILISKHCRIEPSSEDGFRLLTMRYWPRGVRRDRFDAYARNLAPSASLLKKSRRRDEISAGERGGSDDEQAWLEFIEEYSAEMASQMPAISELSKRHLAGETITVLCGCHDPARCHRSVLASLILSAGPEQAPGPGASPQVAGESRSD